MKIVEPGVEILRSGLEQEVILPEKFIEMVGRTCYKSEDKITDDSAAKFVSGLIKRGHEAMLEHWNLVFKTTENYYNDIFKDYSTMMHNRAFLKFTETYDRICYPYVISANIRAWRDFAKAAIVDHTYLPYYLYGIVKNYPLFFPEYQDYVPNIFKTNILTPISVSDLTDSERKVHQNVTVKFVCDRGVSHELVRHRVASFAQESTRYCNYSKDKFGNEITVVRPSWCKEGDEFYDIWRGGCAENEETYFAMLREGATPQEARSVLPNSLKTEVVMTMNLDGWYHFFDLRCANDAHPDMQEVAKMAKTLFLNEKLI